jgi:hypothetical protein
MSFPTDESSSKDRARSTGLNYAEFNIMYIERVLCKSLPLDLKRLPVIGKLVKNG